MRKVTCLRSYLRGQEPGSGPAGPPPLAPEYFPELEEGAGWNKGDSKPLERRLGQSSCSLLGDPDVQAGLEKRGVCHHSPHLLFRCPGLGGAWTHGPPHLSMLQSEGDGSG